MATALMVAAVGSRTWWLSYKVGFASQEQAVSEIYKTAGGVKAGGTAGSVYDLLALEPRLGCAVVEQSRCESGENVFVVGSQLWLGLLAGVVEDGLGP